MKMHQKNSVFNVLEEFFVFKTWTEVKIIIWWAQMITQWPGLCRVQRSTMEQKYKEGVSYNITIENTEIQGRASQIWVTVSRLENPPNSLFLDTMDFLTMEVVAIVLFRAPPGVNGRSPACCSSSPHSPAQWHRLDGQWIDGQWINHK